MRLNVGSSAMDTGDPICNLIAAVVRIAIKDAMQGSDEAINWLADFFPEWAKWVERNEFRSKRAALPEL